MENRSVYKGNPAIPLPARRGRPIKLCTPEDFEERAAEYKRLRSALGLSQKDLSKLTGLALSSLNQMPYVPGRRVPSPDVLDRMRAELERRKRLGIERPQRTRKGGRPFTSEHDRKRRKAEFLDIFARLALSVQNVAEIADRSVMTISGYLSKRPDLAPTWATIEILKAALTTAGQNIPPAIRQETTDQF